MQALSTRAGAAAAVAVLAGIGAVLLAPPATAAEDVDATPWPPAVVRVVGLGRTFAAADIAWLKMVQLLGSDAHAAARWPGLEHWIDLVTGLDASFEEPYFFGATLLVTDRARAPHVDRLLARGEEAFPDVFSFPMMRGFLAQFGMLEPLRAAEHYRRAATKEGAPPYLGRHADTLAKEGASCGRVLADLKQLADTSSRAQAEALSQQRFQIVEHCFARLIERTAITLRLNNETEHGAATLAEVERALGSPVPAPPGRCWRLEGDHASLAPCEPETRP